MYLGLWTLVEAAAWLSSGSRQGSSPDSADTVVVPADPGLRCYAECVFCRISREIGAIQQSAHESVSNLAFINFPFFYFIVRKNPLKAALVFYKGGLYVRFTEVLVV